MTKEKISAKEKILKLLKENGKLATSRIAGIIGLDYNYASKILNELKEQKKVKEIKETMATYWEIKK